MNWFLLGMLFFILEQLLRALQKGEPVPAASEPKLRRCLTRMQEVQHAAASRGILPAPPGDGVAEVLSAAYVPGFLIALFAVLVMAMTVLWIVLTHGAGP